MKYRRFPTARSDAAAHGRRKYTLSAFEPTNGAIDPITLSGIDMSVLGRDGAAPG